MYLNNGQPNVSIFFSFFVNNIVCPSRITHSLCIGFGMRHHSFVHSYIMAALMCVILIILCFISSEGYWEREECDVNAKMCHKTFGSNPLFRWCIASYSYTITIAGRLLPHKILVSFVIFYSFVGVSNYTSVAWAAAASNDSSNMCLFIRFAGSSHARVRARAVMELDNE